MNHQEPEVTNLETILHRAGYQSLEPVKRPAYWGVDLDWSRRPGVPMEREPRPWPNSKFPPSRQQGEPAALKHNRTNREFPPVFGTSSPLHGVSGAMRTFAARFPDHKPYYWITRLAADRVESWGHRAKKYLPFALPLIGAALLARRRTAHAS